MAATSRISIALTPDLTDAVHAAVSSGEYATAADVVQDAVREWKERRDLPGYTVEELCAAVQEGLESGRSTLATMAEVKAEARRRFRAPAPTMRPPQR
ncbi:ribbon-helix-helix domain-containing protein [Tistrella sp.]|jgi:antitoxin ParD1/3/4|uniref:Type II toxin-antitoxin system ParD family antitoxin n=1 Tax=Tistrella mobilis TaxID=171437 RepID=A0A3B9IN06_9PROT|nr:type II toxin-antitoxin system ParD family antitoxin [Tistrella sp.]MAD36108.1 type II toxin-antitoxin system ParD family antitoxin [Tistrella sp.]HAE49254.1 type II toxin-antitoxin system ParD family antitoxin [Tistrella mobilis]|tara:strand:+ start:530 stop:823 length:294 start_codon:yes stop_codon:yes gene_type:complete